MDSNEHLLPTKLNLMDYAQIWKSSYSVHPSLEPMRTRTAY